MKNKDLIEALSKFPLDQEVCIFDYRKVLHFESEEPTSRGVYPDFGVEQNFPSESFITLSFENESYTEDGWSAQENECFGSDVF